MEVHGTQVLKSLPPAHRHDVETSNRLQGAFSKLFKKRVLGNEGGAVKDYEGADERP